MKERDRRMREGVEEEESRRMSQKEERVDRVEQFRDFRTELSRNRGQAPLVDIAVVVPGISHRSRQAAASAASTHTGKERVWSLRRRRELMLEHFESCVSDGRSRSRSTELCRRM